MLINKEDKATFEENGVLVLRGFYDVEKEIIPIQKCIYEILGLIIKKYHLDIEQPEFCAEHFDACYNDVIAVNRSYGSEVYDAVKQIPAFLRLISSQRSEDLFAHLRQTDLVGIGKASYGIRIDHPYEDQFRSQWHQEFLFQPQSVDGTVMWTPLVPVKADMGPVIVCLGSHKDGLRKCRKQGKYSEKTGAYKIGLVDEASVVGSYEQAAPLTNPGDLIVMDYLTIHQSGVNVSKRSRWSIQSRFFNFREPTGIQIGWKPSVTVGTDIEDIFPECFE